MYHKLKNKNITSVKVVNQHTFRRIVLPAVWALESKHRGWHYSLQCFIFVEICTKAPQMMNHTLCCCLTQTGVASVIALLEASDSVMVDVFSWTVTGMRAGSKVLNQLYGGDVELIISVLERGASCAVQAGSLLEGQGGRDGGLECHGWKLDPQDGRSSACFSVSASYCVAKSFSLAATRLDAAFDWKASRRGDSGDFLSVFTQS